MWLIGNHWTLMMCPTHFTRKTVTCRVSQSLPHAHFYVRKLIQENGVLRLFSMGDLSLYFTSPTIRYYHLLMFAWWQRQTRAFRRSQAQHYMAQIQHFFSKSCWRFNLTINWLEMTMLLLSNQVVPNGQYNLEWGTNICQSIQARIKWM